MTLNLIACFVIVGSVLYYLKCRKSGIFFVGLSAILYGAIASALLPDLLMNRLQAPYSSHMQTELEDNTAFILFGMGTQTVQESGKTAVEPLAFSYGTIFAAVRMNQQCLQRGLTCRFVISGGDVAASGTSEAESAATELKKAGVAPASIIQDEQSLNTWQNAKNTALILKNLKPTKVVLLQAAPMLGRSLLYLQHFGVKPEAVASAFLTMQHTNMSSTGLYFLATDLALHEQFGTWRYALYNFIGWNEPKQHF
ncbi:YdcF family protein [Brucella pituitosa]|uniref:YdcF family protein n=1 Tax=Brucella pituitosa TaxID=571256 RepID=UPI0009A13B97|nr:YdcF family protein [Brucella pituitosa]